MNKAYNKITWQNKPSTATPLNQTNLNEMSNALDTIDDRVIALDSGKVGSVTVTNTLPDGDTIATITVDGTATNIKSAQVEVDAEPSATSENPLQNKAIYEMLNNLLPEETAQGNPIAISDASGLNAKACSVDLPLIQDLHGYDSPWVGGAGKNKCNPANISVFNSNKYFSTLNYSTTPMIPVKASTQYVLSCRKGSPSINQDFRIYYWDSNNTAISNEKANPFTTPSNCAKVSFYCGYSDGDFTDGDDVKAQVEEGSTATAWTPYENICPISGRTEASVTRTGVNQWDEQWESGSINANTGEPTTDNTRVRSKNFTRVKPSTEYYALPNVQVFGYDKNYSYVGVVHSATTGGTFTTSNNCYYIKFRTPNTYGGTYNNDLGVNYPSTATAYEPYNGETVTIQFGQTVYGGTLDVTNGKLTIDKAFYTFDGTESWTITGSGSAVTNIIGMKSVVKTEKAGLCSKLKTDSGVNGCAQFGADSATNQFFIIGASAIYDIDTQAKARTFTTDMQICYPLATPIEITLTAEQISLLKGNNVVSTDGDNIKLVYSADIGLYIAGQLQS